MSSYNLIPLATTGPDKCKNALYGYLKHNRSYNVNCANVTFTLNALKLVNLTNNPIQTIPTLLVKTALNVLSALRR